MLEMAHILTDAFITLAYYSIPVSIYIILKRKKTLEFKKIYWLFILFIFSCGTTHLLHLLGIWMPLDLLTGMVKLITAVVSIMTAIVLWYILPELMGNPTSKDLQKVNESLQEERNFVSAILDTLDAIVVVLDAKGNVVKVNPSFEHLTGYTQDDMKGKNFVCTFFPHNKFKMIDMMSKLQNPGQPNRYESRIITKAGDSFYISWSNTVLKGNDGLIKNIISTGIDITKRKNEEDAMRINKEILKDTLKETLQQHQGMIFKLKMKNGRFVCTFADGQLLYRLNLSPSMVTGKHTLELFKDYPEEVANELIKFYLRAWHGEENVRYEYMTKCGMDTITVLNTIKKNGKITEVIGSTTDITKEKSMERDLQESEKKYRLMAENISDMLIILDSEWNTQYASPSHERILGYQEDHLVGNNQLSFIHPDDHHRILEWFAMIWNANQPYQAEYRYRHHNGDWIHVDARGMPIRDNQGHVDSIVLFCRDITEHKKTEEIIRKWERVSAVGELAAGIAHEIRNPLTTLTGFVQLLKRDEENGPYLDLMHSELSRIELVTNEFLMLAKPQVTKYQKENLISILDSVITMLNTQAIMSNTYIRMEVEIDRPTIHGDGNHLKQVFINVLKNAIESMPNGGDILVKVQPYKVNQVSIQFIDQGMGIPEELLPKLGEPFYTLKEKGTGLGLMISFKIIKEHQGDVHIYSVFGEGTTVNIYLPLVAENSKTTLV
jgi:PAS domain S-box-containing protein